MLTINQIEDLEAAGVEPVEWALPQPLTAFGFLFNLSNHLNTPVHTRITHADPIGPVGHGRPALPDDVNRSVVRPASAVHLGASCHRG